MTWLTLRLQRTELIVLLVAAAVLGFLFTITANEAVQLNRPYTAANCPVPLTSAGDDSYCYIEPSTLYMQLNGSVDFLSVLPLLVALLLALPLVTELHDRTYRLAWTQSLTRGQWTRNRLLLIMAIGLLLTAASVVLFRWWLPGNYVGFGEREFDLPGIVPFGSFIFAVGLVLGLGTLIRRPLVAILAAAFAYLVVTLSFREEIRPYLLEPEVRPEGDPAFTDQNAFTVQLDQWFQRPDGTRVTGNQFYDLCGDQLQTQNGFERCVATNDLTSYFEYQPWSRYWPFQFIETGIFAAAGLALIGFSVWYWVRRLE